MKVDNIKSELDATEIIHFTVVLVFQFFAWFFKKSLVNFQNSIKDYHNYLK